MNKQTNNKILTVIIILGLIVSVIVVWQHKVPSSGQIFDKADKYWENKKFNELRDYASQLEAAYPDYIPAELAVAISAKKCDVKYAKSIAILEHQYACFENNYVYIPFVLTELIRCKLKREQENFISLNEYLAKNNISRDEYFKRLLPDNKRRLRFANHFENEVLFFNIPKAFITTNSVEYLSLPMSLKNNFTLVLKSEVELKKIVFNYEASMIKREKARNKLVVKRYQTGGITNLFQGFSTTEYPYMSLATAQKLYTIGEESLPYIVEHLNVNISKHIDSEMVLWAIMMIQYNGLSKAETLQYVNQIDEYYFENSKYARRIREFLNDND
jgi:hypothetical protein